MGAQEGEAFIHRQCGMLIHPLSVRQGRDAAAATAAAVWAPPPPATHECTVTMTRAHFAPRHTVWYSDSRQCDSRRDVNVQYFT